MTNTQRLARIFAALSVNTRLCIIAVLKQRTLCVGALSSLLGVTPGAISQHLRILRDADLVVPQKRGYYVHYRINDRTLAKWRKSIAKFLGTDKRERPCPRRPTKRR